MLEAPRSTDDGSFSDTRFSSGVGGVIIITNVKPWVLDVHPWRSRMSDKVFVQAASDSSFVARPQASSCSGLRPEKSMLWSNGLGDNAYGSYIDFSSFAGADWWKTHIMEELLDNQLTGVWCVSPYTHIPL